jgi:8-oxo-dGTP pyrophosphatase MutT (NUDIX family)
MQQTAEKIALHTVGLVVTRGNKLLLAYSNNKNAWYLPGGKIDAGETAVTALQREIAEELGIQLHTAKLQYYTHITAPAFGEQENIIMEQDCYIYPLTENVQFGNEIGGVQFFSTREYATEPAQVPGVKILFEQLLKDGVLTGQ